MNSGILQYAIDSRPLPIICFISTILWLQTANHSLNSAWAKMALQFFTGVINNYYHFVGHCGAFCGLKWRIWRAKTCFSPLK